MIRLYPVQRIGRLWHLRIFELNLYPRIKQYELQYQWFRRYLETQLSHKKAAVSRSLNPVFGVLLVSMLCVGGARASTIYVYQGKDGSRLITDHLHHEEGYRLIKSYGVDRSGWATPTTAGPGRLRPVRSRFDNLISNTASQFGVDAALVKAVMHVESAFNPYAISRKGASGLMQLMPQTAERYGVRSLFDPRQNIAGGVRYLRDLLSEFDGNTLLALAGYNAGENAVIRYNGVPPYPETKGYVKKVMSLYHSYQALP